MDDTRDTGFSELCVTPNVDSDDDEVELAILQNEAEEFLGSGEW